MRWLVTLICGTIGVLTFARLIRAAPMIVSGYAVNYYVSSIDGSFQPYGVYIPNPYDSGRAHPVVIHMHGFGGRLGGFSPWQTDWADAKGWILISSDGRGNNNYDGIGEDDLFRILDDIKARYRIDEDRIYLTGGSMGGHGAYRMPLRFPHIFTAGAPIAGWTDYRDFYTRYYEQSEGTRAPDYVDPSRRPILETASSLWQTENGKYIYLLMGYGTWDYINAPSNAEQVVQRMQEFGYKRHAARGDWGGHMAGYDTEEIYNYFEGKVREHRVPAPVYVTNTVKYNRAYWIRTDRLRVQNEWSRLAAKAEGDVVHVEAENVAAYTLLPDDSPLDFQQPLTVYTNGLLTYQGTPNGPLSIEARYDDRYRVVGWAQSAPPAADAPVRKRHGLQGPLNDAYLSRFVVTYGTAGTLEDTARNRRDALRFCAEWNNWMVCHWSWGRPPRSRRTNWFEPPYPFKPGDLIPEDQPLLLPIKDTEITDEQIANANLVLYGDPRTHRLIARIRDRLPLALTDSGVSMGSRSYAGPSVNYTFICPNPLNPAHYVVVSRGYLSSRIDPYKDSVGATGKDLEALPFFWPDYVIWDGDRLPGRTVQSPFVYLPETYLEAGYFDENWRLDSDPPGTTAFVSGEDAPVDVALVAEDRPGGFGVAYSEYRLDGGPWTQYAGPIRISQPGEHFLQYRSVDRCGQFVYERVDGHNRGRDADGNVEPVREMKVRVR